MGGKKVEGGRKKEDGFIVHIMEGMTNKEKTMKRCVRGFTLVEIMIVVAIIALLAAIAIPNVLRGRTTANESAAIGNLRALVSSLEMWRSVNSAYPNPWTDLFNATPAYGPPSFNVSMANNTVQGYLYRYTALSANAAYNIIAQPATVNRTGTRSFYVDEAATIRHCTGNAAPTASNNTIDQQPNSSC